MLHTLMELPYSLDSLQPFMSKETLEFHYWKHHKAYVDKLNSLIAWTEYENMSLEDIILQSKQWPIFNNAAQIWNHNFFWKSLSINNWEKPQGRLADMIVWSFWSFEDMKVKFKTESLSRFWSGWVWLIQKWELLEIYSSPNAEDPLTLWGNTLLWCDVWEHSYYIDYRNDRWAFIDNFWNIVNWKFVEEQVQ